MDVCIGEVEDLLASTLPGERDVSGYTRGKRVDAYKQERELDRAMEESGELTGDQDVEITAAVGRR